MILDKSPSTIIVLNVRWLSNPLFVNKLLKVSNNLSSFRFICSELYPTRLRLFSRFLPGTIFPSIGLGVVAPLLL